MDLMKNIPNSVLPVSVKSPQSLDSVLGQSEQVKYLVEECAEGLATVNTALKQELAGKNALPLVAGALEQSVAVESKVHKTHPISWPWSIASWNTKYESGRCWSIN